LEERKRRIHHGDTEGHGEEGTGEERKEPQMNAEARRWE